MEPKTAFLFPGQGSQKIGMGRAWAESFAEARAAFDEASEALENKTKNKLDKQRR